jgi:hypothetical protein
MVLNAPEVWALHMSSEKQNDSLLGNGSEDFDQITVTYEELSTTQVYIPKYVATTWYETFVNG